MGEGEYQETYYKSSPIFTTYDNHVPIKDFNLSVKTSTFLWYGFIIGSPTILLNFLLHLLHLISADKSYETRTHHTSSFSPVYSYLTTSFDSELVHTDHILKWLSASKNLLVR